MIPELRTQCAWAAAATLLVIGCAACILQQGLTTPSPSLNANRTIWDGVYTEEQSQRGEATYTTTCVLCHKPELTGTEIIPSLVGEMFLSRWGTRTAGDLFEQVRTSMPPNVALRLTPQEYADVLAYIFNRNQFPTGQEELAGSFEPLSLIRMTPSQ